jgi:membrane protease YdiL (CAAX protease family)
MPWSALVLFVLLAYAITWLSWLPGLLQHKSIFTVSLPLTLLGGMGPAIASVITTAVMERRNGLAWLGRRLVQWRVPFRWYLVALLLPLCCSLVAMVPGMLQGGRFAGLALPGGAGVLLSSYLTQTLLTGGNEELGWRGFALPALQARFSAFTASIILAVVWAVWHLPLFFMAGTSQSQSPFVLFLLFTIPLTIVFTWLHNQTGGSILLAMLFHGAFNTTAGLVRIYMFDPWVVATWLVLAALIVTVAGPKRLARGPGALSEAA